MGGELAYMRVSRKALMTQESKEGSILMMMERSMELKKNAS